MVSLWVLVKAMGTTNLAIGVLPSISTVLMDKSERWRGQTTEAKKRLTLESLPIVSTTAPRDAWAVASPAFLHVFPQLGVF